ncbi:phosphatase, partial [Pseudoalteromonas sp. S185]|uniref:alkaline phosphatase PhoX n=1 Tax=Pseudoalteromonas sp. S185 TaxID=2066522 RepID=UPI001107E5DB
ISNHKSPLAYDSLENGVALPGGTSHIIFNLKEQKRELEYLSLCGTLRNCSGGVTPWGSWLTCEETVMDKSDGLSQSHGKIFEVPGSAKGLIKPERLYDMGR